MNHVVGRKRDDGASSGTIPSHIVLIVCISHIHAKDEMIPACSTSMLIYVIAFTMI
jgi:hypothetical protein